MYRESIVRKRRVDESRSGLYLLLEERCWPNSMAEVLGSDFMIGAAALLTLSIE